MPAPASLQRRWLCSSAALGTYNQVHLSWNSSAVEAIWYVNASLAAPLPAKARLMRAAQLALETARRMQAVAGPLRGAARPPLLQLRLGTACNDGWRGNGSTPQQRRALAERIFAAPPP